SAYDEQKSGLDHVSASLILLDRQLAQYGPEAQKPRELLRRTVADAVERIWPEDAAQTPTLAAPGTTARGTTFYESIEELSPQNDKQRRLQSAALQGAADLGQARWLLVAQGESSAVPMPFLAVLVFWLAVLFLSFGLFASPNATVVTTLFLS